MFPSGSAQNKKNSFVSMSGYSVTPLQEFSKEKDLRLFGRIAAFFEADKARVEKLIEISRISNRVVDFFITTVCKKKKIKPDDTSFDIYAQYKMSLRSYGKPRFDIFKRSVEKINVTNANGLVLTSTIAQLNMIKWLISSGICDYILENEEFVTQMTKKFSRRARD